MLLPLKAILSKKPRRDGNFPIYFQYCYSSKNRLLLSTEIAIPSGYWNPKRQCISKSLPIEYGNAEKLNEELSRLKKIIEALIDHGQKSGETNVGQYVKSRYSIDFDSASLPEPTAIIPFHIPKKQEPNFTSELEDYIKSKKKKVKPASIGCFTALQHQLMSFQEFRKVPIKFSDLDYTFYSDLVEYLTYEYKLKRKVDEAYGLKVATIGKTIKQLRMFIKDRVRRKRIAPIDMTEYKILDEQSDAIYLSYAEIGRMYALDLTLNPTLALYRDMFVLGTLTGLRFSDYSTLSWTDLRGDLLYKKTSKMDSWVVIPLRAEAMVIMERRFKNARPYVSNPLFNAYIKEIAALAGIKEPITISYKKGNRDIVHTVAKWQLVTTHTCRRSFATNEYLAGTDISLIMRVTGHKTQREFFKYIRISEEEAARKIQEVWLARNNMSAFPLSVAV